MAEAGASARATDQADSPCVLEAQGLCLSWDGRREIVHGLDLQLHSGEIVCLVGQSGCGKTTILHALAGLLVPVRGRVLLEGANITGQPGNISYMLQKDLLLPHKRIIDNVCLPLLLAGSSAAQARATAGPLFERFGLQGCQNAWPHELSGGMRQRAAFLRTYLMGAKVTLLDEPFSALDAFTRSSMRSWFVTMATELGISALVITHDVDEALALGHRVLVLAGRPSSVVGGVPGAGELTAAFVEGKRRILELLGYAPAAAGQTETGQAAADRGAPGRNTAGLGSLADSVG